LKKLTEEDIEVNRSGTLTKDQLWNIKSKGVVNAIAGACFFALIPLAYFASNIRSGAMLIIFLVGGSLLGAAFLWIAWGYLFIKPDGHEIITITGKVEKKNSGNKSVVLKIGDRSFLLRKNDVAAIKEGEEYTIHYLGKQRIPIGWMRA
jgi:hypothetical protein